MKKKYILIIILCLVNLQALFSQWVGQSSGTTSNLYSVYFLNDYTGWAVGYHGKMLKTTNSGENWFNQDSRTTQDLSSVFFANKDTGWAVGYSSEFIKTTNGGDYWLTHYELTNNPANLNSIIFTDNNTGWAVGGQLGDGWSYKTTNGGINWVNSVGSNNLFEEVFFVNKNTGWIVGYNGTILKTTNGSNWVSQSSGTTSILTKVYFINENTGWVAGTYGGFTEILKTTNGGTNWISKTITSTGGSLNSLFFINIGTGWAVGSDIYKSTDGGMNWTIVPTLPHFYFSSIFFTTNNIGWIAGSGGTILHNNGFEVGNDVGVTKINIPKRDTIIYTGCFTGSVITPNVTIINLGTNNQNVPFNVECQIIYNSVTVYSDIRQDTISSYQSHSLEFEPFVTPPYLGDYKIFVKTMLPGDTIYYDDTASSWISTFNNNFGIEPYRGDVDGIRYRFANSTIEASCAPYSLPAFDWQDTTGCINLITNGIPVIPLYSGNIDNGRFNLPDLLENEIFSFYHATYFNYFFVNTDGFIYFIGDYWSGFIMPFYCDLNFGDNDVVGRNLKYKVTSDKIIFTYDRVPLKNDSYSPEDYLTFQVILNINESYDNTIIFQYDRASTGATFLNKYFNNELPFHKVGISFDVQGILNFGIDYRYKNNSNVLINYGPIFESNSIAVAFAENENVLPVELASFTSTVSENNVSLLWVVNLQINNSGFDIERSRVNNQTSVEWIKIGSVSGNGSSTNEVQYSFTDMNLSTGKYKYRLKQIDLNGSFKYYDLQNEVVIGIPDKFNLSQNYPNPFNPQTRIDFDLPKDSKVILKIYDISGREIRTLLNEFRSAGYYTIDFNGSNLASSAYFYKLTAGEFTGIKRMMMIK